MACERCKDTGLESWSGHYVGRDVTYITLGPCLRCRVRDFMLAYRHYGNRDLFFNITYTGSMT